jgi:hypothetical protein
LKFNLIDNLKCLQFKKALHKEMSKLREKKIERRKKIERAQMQKEKVEKMEMDKQN